ncbi:Universal stress protein family protein [Pricia antarctica]|uniref:Universal stress protein family protein n=1 Tax=Pricia antarctica TaxID=641691 RepID=A0A1G7D0R5_9FLAO|nr:Universal stress protein family protein [Pricia antarctica]
MNKISTILVPFDFSESAKKALEYAVAFTGRDDDIQIVLAHVSGHGNF